MSGSLNLIKLCVGAESVEDLRAWRKTQHARQIAAGEVPRSVHVTRMWPKRSAELLDGGSLYWVFKGAVLARQKIDALEEVIREDGIRRCAIVMDPEIVLVETRPRRPFQGWRYLTGEDAPPDLSSLSSDAEGLPPALALALSEVGVVAR